MEIQFEAELVRFNSDLWGHHFIVPEKFAAYLVTNKIRRLVCLIENRVEFQCALMPLKTGEHFINVNKENRKKLKWRIGEIRSIELRQDQSKYGLDMPEELAELLNIDEEGNDVFHQLTPGKQRNLIYIAGKPKTSATRLKKSIIIIDYLKSVNGKLDFKELNQAFKDRNKEF